MRHVFQRDPNAELPVAVRGEGIHLFDRAGRCYIDACGGVVVSSLGHNHPRIVDAIKRQVDRLSYAHAGAFANEPAEELAEFLTERSPGLGYAYFLSGGSEIMEVALKTAYQYHVERGAPDRSVVIARRQNYHGSTFGALAITGNAQRRSIFEPFLATSPLVSPCYAYREQRAAETDADYGARLARELEGRILEIGPHKVAAFVAETVVGSTSGAVPPVAGYFRAIRAVCDTYGILLVLDEVMCGMGRTGPLFACLDDGVSPDILLVGKGLGAGYIPLSAMLVAPKIHDAIKTGSGSLRNGQTFVNHPLACAAALEVQKTIVDGELLDNVRQRGEQLRALLRETFADHPHIGDIRGRGLFIGVEFVADRDTKEPFPAERRLHAALKTRAWARGLMIYPMGGTIDGTRGDHVLFAPPFICTKPDIETIAGMFSDVVKDVFPQVR